MSRLFRKHNLNSMRKGEGEKSHLKVVWIVRDGRAKRVVREGVGQGMFKYIL